MFLYRAGITSVAAAGDAVALLKSAAGRRLVAAAGFVPIRYDGHRVGALTGATAGYAALVAGAKRLAVDLRLRPLSDRFDSRSIDDLARVTARPVGERFAPERIMVLGIGDPGGADPSLARRVAALLAERGLEVGTVRDLGGVMPVVETRTPAERNRKRRVEVWLRP